MFSNQSLEIQSFLFIRELILGSSDIFYLLFTASTIVLYK